MDTAEDFNIDNFDLGDFDLGVSLSDYELSNASTKGGPRLDARRGIGAQQYREDNSPPAVLNKVCLTRAQVDEMEKEEPESPSHAGYQGYPSIRQRYRTEGLKWESRTKQEKFFRKHTKWLRRVHQELAFASPDPPKRSITIPGELPGETYDLALEGWGAEYLTRYGWTPGEGLGRHNTGRTIPVAPARGQLLAPKPPKGQPAPATVTPFPFPVDTHNEKAWDWIKNKLNSRRKPFSRDEESTDSDSASASATSITDLWS
ncbi:hypothetical protein BDR22DRAFT_895172 [Usnea florida]